MTVYYTQLIFVREGGEEAFQRFEELVLPLLARHNGRLEYRVRPAADAVIESVIGRPFEVHLVSFATKEDFEAYSRDPERKKHLALKDESIERALLIEGQAL
jgi:hypothetical protein